MKIMNPPGAPILPTIATTGWLAAALLAALPDGGAAAPEQARVLLHKLGRDLAQSATVKAEWRKIAAGGALAQLADLCLCAPEYETYKVQELHLPLYHTLCLALEDRFFPPEQ